MIFFAYVTLSDPGYIIIVIRSSTVSPRLEDNNNNKYSSDTVRTTFQCIVVLRSWGEDAKKFKIKLIRKLLKFK